jgi:CRP/FNR family transcriptional regulator, cyclic AMP receptor protein
MNQEKKGRAESKEILARMHGNKLEVYLKDQSIYSHGDPASCIFYIRAGNVKVTVVSSSGKEGVVGILQPGELCGEECVAGHEWRLTTATALTDCEVLRLEKKGVVRALREEPAFAELFISHLLARSLRMQEDLVDQLLNSTEKRLARLLLILANYGREEEGPDPIMPRISQETLGEMIGTSRTQVNFFMNKFRQLGLIDYNGSIKVHRSLLNILLHDRPQAES